MSKSGIFTSSIAKKYWMALTGLFLITFLIGHLLGNLQLITKTGEEGRRAFNEYAYFMGHNIFIKILAYATYISILAHAFLGLYLAVKNKQARPKNYAYNKPSANSGAASRYMAILGTIILVFICTHMANFWYKQKVAETVPLHYVEVKKVQQGQDPMTGQPVTQEYTEIQALTTMGVYFPIGYINPQTNEKEIQIKPEGTKFKDPQSGLVAAEGYRDLHTVVMNFFGQSEQGQPTNQYALIAVILYVVSMFVLMFHLWHGFASSFQSLGLNHRKYNGLISFVGKAFAIVVPLLFAIIPVIIYLRK
ncbi:succinate dehydrogenase cytochrome b subunit [Fluviicola sp.]|uniref:succinate dehydrogenase cytochrome b subunit n=1 Tax=Fluviicola sp. TaxID=1917219 RepID=UPI00262C5343|nr:succinate dehydrogenase cytochrome b subunit [Fluviicola sp.]